MGKSQGNFVIDQETITPYDLCNQCSKYGPNFLVGKLRINDFRDQSFSPSKINYSQVK